MQTEPAAAMLELCCKGRLSVAEAIKRVGGSHDGAMKLIRELKLHRLLTEEVERGQTVGRPRHRLRPTPLGRRFVSDYKKLRSLPLQCNDNDVRKAMHQADLARRLVEKGIAPYVRLQELNQLARNIRSTAKTQRDVR